MPVDLVVVFSAFVHEQDYENKKRVSIRRDTAVRYPPRWKSTITLDVGNLGVLLCFMRKLS